MNVITRNIPNSITCLNLAAGVMAIICAAQGDRMLWGLEAYNWAYIFIGIAAVADFLDGFAARLLHAYSELGKELDSLCDMVSFGVAPAIIMYYCLDTVGIPAWTRWLVFLIPVCGALRLAKFNIDTRQTTSFIGLPIPANAIFWIGASAWISSYHYPGTIVVVAVILAMSLCMVAPMRMFSLKFKNLSLHDNVLRYGIVLACIAFVIFYRLPGLMWTILLYILLSLFSRKKEDEAEA